MDSERFNIQASRYHFPYHHLPAVDDSGLITIHHSLIWGLEYLTYMTFIQELIVNDLRAKSVLDVGCGDGRLSSMLHEKVPLVAGCDLVEQAILFARAFNPELKFFHGNVADVPGRFEVTTLVEVMEHIPDESYPEFIETVGEKTAVDGVLIVSVPTVNRPQQAKHHRHYTLKLLEEHLAPTFEIQRYWFLVKTGPMLRLLNRMLQNSACITLPDPWRRTVWRLHKKHTYWAHPNTGAHLIAIAKIVS